MTQLLPGVWALLKSCSSKYSEKIAQSVSTFLLYILLTIGYEGAMKNDAIFPNSVGTGTSPKKQKKITGVRNFNPSSSVLLSTGMCGKLKTPSSCTVSLMYKKKQQGTKDSALWDIKQDRDPIRFCSVYNNALLSVA